MAGAVLVTGVSSAVGRHTAITLTRAGYPVLAAVETAAAATEARAAAAAAQAVFGVRVLDVTSDESVRTCVEFLAAAHGGLDALVAVLGPADSGSLGSLGSLAGLSPRGLRTAWERDVVGLVRLVRAVLPGLRAARGRLVCVTGVGGAVGLPFRDADCAVKFGVEGLLESFAPVAAGLGVRTTVVQPGPVAGADAGLLARIGEPQPAAEIAEVVLDVLCSPDPPFRCQTTAAATRFVATKLTDVHGTAVRELAAAWLAETEGGRVV